MDSITLGDYAYKIIDQQFHHLTKQKSGVLADQDPECLHKMRVSARRLKAALQLFDGVIDLPQAAQIKAIRKLGEVLGKLRDLDVQIDALESRYAPNLDADEQKEIKVFVKSLHQRRTQIFKKVESSLERSGYKTLTDAYQHWLKQPQYCAIAPTPLNLLVPDLLSPLLTKLLRHPGWFVTRLDQEQQPQQHYEQVHEQTEMLHDLRKTCKAVRYQAEFLTPFYDLAFQDWIGELKTMQDQLGSFQDGEVLLQMLPAKLPELKAKIREEQIQALEAWESLRCRYVAPEFRQTLRAIVVLQRPG